MTEITRKFRAYIAPDWGHTWPGVFLYMNDIVDIDIQQSCFLKSQPSDSTVIPITVGQCNVGELTMTYLQSAGEVHPTDLVYVYFSAVTGSTEQAFLLGTFRIKKVSKNQSNGTVTIQGYDKLSDTELYSEGDLQYYGLIGNNPTDIEIIDAICTFLNYSKDQSVTDAIIKGYHKAVSSGEVVLCRDLLAQIAAVYGGAFYMENTRLYFTDLLLAPESNLLMARETYDGDPSLLTIEGDHIIVHPY